MTKEYIQVWAHSLKREGLHNHACVTVTWSGKSCFPV